MYSFFLQLITLLSLPLGHIVFIRLWGTWHGSDSSSRSTCWTEELSGSKTELHENTKDEDFLLLLFSQTQDPVEVSRQQLTEGNVIYSVPAVVSVSCLKSTSHPCCLEHSTPWTLVRNRRVSPSVVLTSKTNCGRSSGAVKPCRWFPLVHRRVWINNVGDSTTRLTGHRRLYVCV